MTIKVLHLIDSGGLYGAEKMLLALVSEQIKQGLEPMILSAAEPDIEHKALETEARRLGLPVIPWRMKPGFNLRDSLAIIRWAQSEGYEVFHSHGYKFNVLIGLWPERIRKIPLMATLHGYVKAPRFTKSWLYESLDRLALRQMRCVVVVAEAMKKDIPRGLAESGSVRVIPNGLDTALLEKAANEPLESELASFFENHEPVVLGVGRLSPEKGFDRLIEAFKAVKDRHTDAGLVIIGEGNQRKSLEQGIRKLGLTDSVIMPGYYE
ncbi:MAG: glycosyltransferase, partial [Oleiphilaceae bacterium]|nr:glycosyltransferase [Oleiphilaceae bacterium]